MGIEVLKSRRYYKEVILQQYKGIRVPLTIKNKIGLNRGIRALLIIKSRIGLGKGIKAPLTIKSRIGFSRGIAQVVIKKASITIFG